MRSDLAQLKREAESGTIKTGSQSVMLRAASRTFGRSSRLQTYLLVGMAALLVTVLASVGAWWIKHREVANAEQRNAIAVLPLQNLNGDFNIDYLRFALADELSSVLTYSRSLEVRPSSVTRKYVALDLDPKKVGQELRVGRLLQGHFIKQGDTLTVTLEAIDVPTERLLWQSTVSGKAEDLIGMREQLSAQVQHGLLPILGGAAGPWITGLLYDLTGTYSIAFSIAAGCSLVSILAIWLAAPGKVRAVAGRAGRLVAS